VTYVVNKQGKVIHILNSQKKAEQYIKESIKALKNTGNHQAHWANEERQIAAFCLRQSHPTFAAA